MATLNADFEKFCESYETCHKQTYLFRYTDANGMVRYSEYHCYSDNEAWEFLQVFEPQLMEFDDLTLIEPKDVTPEMINHVRSWRM